MFFFMRGYQLGKDIKGIEVRLAGLKDQLDCLHHDVGHLHEMAHAQQRLLRMILEVVIQKPEGMTPEEVTQVTKEANEIADRLGAINRPPTNVATGPVSIPKSASNVPK